MDVPLPLWQAEYMLLDEVLRIFWRGLVVFCSRLDCSESLMTPLAIQIALEAHDLEAAEKLLGELEVVDRPPDFRHRRSFLYAARHQWGKALDDAGVARTRHPPRFEAFANRVNILIEQSRYTDAERRIAELERLFTINPSRQDVLLGLRTKMMLREGNHQKGAFWTQLNQKDIPVHRALRIEILRQKADDPNVNATEKQRAKSEMRALGQVPTPAA